jgi:hypothetical protein
MKRSIMVAAAATALVIPSTALANGVVLKVQRTTHLVAVATTPTRVALVHTGAALRVGQRVEVAARTLRNGTFAASSVRVVGRAHRVRFRGLLLAKDRHHVVVSAGGAVVAVGGTPPATTPAPGTTIDVTATVTPTGELEDEDVDAAPTSPGGKIEGRLTLGTGTVTVTSEHLMLVLRVPAGLDLSAFRNGDEVLASFTQDATTGALTLTTLSGDEDAQQADENDDDHGGDHHGDGDHGGGSGDDGDRRSELPTRR